MTIRRLPEIKAFEKPAGFGYEPPADAMSRWNGALRAAADESDGEIDIFDVIGQDWWTGGGVTAKSVATQLKGKGAVTVNINSPGGDFFEGIAIYNVLRAHDGKVIVKVMGLAASAASIIAMAGDEVLIAKAAFLMIHNTWCLCMGDRHDMADASDFLAPFDTACAEVYAARTGKKTAAIAEMLDNETWISGDDAVKQKFADGLLPADAVREDAKAKAQAGSVTAQRRIDEVLAKNGVPRSERRSLIKELRGTPGAAAHVTATPGAGQLSDVAASLRRLNQTIRP